MRNLGTSIVLVCCFLAGVAGAQPPSTTSQIASAVIPAPEDLRDSATVLGYTSEGGTVTLRDGEGDLICLADNPSDERLHVACYYKQLDPFMARGRELRAQGKERDEIVATREAEIREGKLEMPSQPTALYSYTGPPEAFDPETGEVTAGNRVYVVYIPYATADMTGLSTKPVTGAPWLMAAGKPWAHVMLVQPVASDEE